MQCRSRERTAAAKSFRFNPTRGELFSPELRPARARFGILFPPDVAYHPPEPEETPSLPPFLNETGPWAGGAGAHGGEEGDREPRTPRLPLPGTRRRAWGRWGPKEAAHAPAGSPAGWGGAGGPRPSSSRPREALTIEIPPGAGLPGRVCGACAEFRFAVPLRRRGESSQGRWRRRPGRAGERRSSTGRGRCRRHGSRAEPQQRGEPAAFTSSGVAVGAGRRGRLGRLGPGRARRGSGRWRGPGHREGSGRAGRRRVTLRAGRFGPDPSQGRRGCLERWGGPRSGPGRGCRHAGWDGYRPATPGPGNAAHRCGSQPKGCVMKVTMCPAKINCLYWGATQLSACVLRFNVLSLSVIWSSYHVMSYCVCVCTELLQVTYQSLSCLSSG